MKVFRGFPRYDPSYGQSSLIWRENIVEWTEMLGCYVSHSTRELKGGWKALPHTNLSLFGISLSMAFPPSDVLRISKKLPYM